MGFFNKCFQKIDNINFYGIQTSVTKKEGKDRDSRFHRCKVGGSETPFSEIDIVRLLITRNTKVDSVDPYNLLSDDEHNMVLVMIISINNVSRPTKLMNTVDDITQKAEMKSTCPAFRR